ncbi:MAG: CHAT domain-containing protein [Proteobacteria bacterium]|nr:CHAT domain-containing protein [Pseudomonadota bacterium]
MSFIRVLFLAAHPEGISQSGSAWLALDEEARAIEHKLRVTRHRDSVELITQWAVRRSDLQDALREHEPHIVHFSGHAGTQGIYLVDDHGAPKPVSGRALSMILRTAGHGVRVVVFNACYAEVLARAVIRQVDFAIGMRDRVADDASRIFAYRFYNTLAYGKSVQNAFDSAVAELALHGHPDEKQPILLPAEGADADKIVLVHPAPEVDDSAPAPVDVLLVCALKDEYDQVKAVATGLLGDGWIETTGPGGFTVADARFATAAAGPLHIRATWATHMGREQAQAAASLLIADQPARCLAMSGICAGRRGKVSLGDVIFADRLWSYDAGKLIVEDGQERFQGDMIQFRPPGAWIQQMQKLAVPSDAPWLAKRPEPSLDSQEDWILLELVRHRDPRQSPELDRACPDWEAVLRRLWQRQWVSRELALTEKGRDRAQELALLHVRGLPAPAPFAIHVAPLATGAAVIEDEGIFPRLASSMRKVLGVEMEASALGALADLHGIPIVIAKGVADYGDAFKDDRYRAFAARTAAECLIALLRNALK